MKTTSFEISQELSKIKFDAETEFYWVETGKGRKQLDYVEFEVGCFQQDWKYTKAFDLETILEALPEKIALYKIDHHLNIYKDYLVYERATGAGIYECNKQDNESLADMAARLLILLESKNLIKFK